MRPPRLEGFSYIGRHCYSLTLNTFKGSERFTDALVVDDVRAQFLRAASEFRFAIHAYCFNRDHAHLLVEGASRDSDLRAFVAIAKQRSAFVVRDRSHAASGSLDTTTASCDQARVWLRSRSTS